MTSHDQFESILDGPPILRTYNNFTVNAGHTVTPTQRCKGLYLNILGDLVINGNLSMSSRGASAVGQFVAVDKETKKIYYFNAVPTDPEYTNHLSRFILINKAGGIAVTATENTRPAPANNNACGVGGGAGGASRLTTYTSVKGGSGTSFSGGPGAGGGTDYHIDGVSWEYFQAGEAGAINGGKGGAGRNGRNVLPSKGGGGGAGNPGGACQETERNGKSGTGGLMILFVHGDIIIGAQGSIQAHGAKGGDGKYVSGRYTAWAGAGSGGGAIHIVHRGTITGSDKVTAIGGAGGTNSSSPTYKKIAQPGGNGTVNIIKV